MSDDDLVKLLIESEELRDLNAGLLRALKQLESELNEYGITFMAKIATNAIAKAEGRK
jgi:hypothetical protein